MEQPHRSSIDRRKQPGRRRLSSPRALHLIPGSPPNTFRDTARRVFFEYIIPLLPIISTASLSKMFSTSMEVSPFITFLRILSIPATAQYLGPKECMLIGKGKRDKVIDEYYSDAKLMLESEGLFSPLESIQGKLLLSFCARRHVGIPTPENRHWFRIAITELQSFQRKPNGTTRLDGPSTRLWRRLWWTSYLHERLDAFNRIGCYHETKFSLNAQNMPRLTLDDFDFDTPLVSNTDQNVRQSRIGVLERDLRIASIHVQKIWLASQIDDPTCTRLDISSDLPHGKELTFDQNVEIVSDRQFWDAYKIQTEFENWQKKNENNDTVIISQCELFPHLAVHWASLYVFYCRILIAFYFSALPAVTMKPKVSQKEVVQHLLGRDRIVDLSSRIVCQAKSLLDHGQVAYAQATDPNIWQTLLAAAELLKADEDCNARRRSRSEIQSTKSASTSCSNVTAAFQKTLLKWKSVPSPADTHSPDFFSLPRSPESTDQSTELAASALLKVESPQPQSATAIASSSMEWVGLDTDHMLQNMEAILFQPRIEFVNSN